MNNLETDILKVLIENHIQSNTSITAKAVAETCMKWIESAFQAGIIYGTNDEDGRAPQDALIGFLRQNGLTPTEPEKPEPQKVDCDFYLNNICYQVEDDCCLIENIKKMKRFIKVLIEKDELVIRIKESDLVWAAERMPDLPNKIVNREEWLKEVSHRLQEQDLGNSNAVETGLTALEYLLDQCFTDIIESASDNVELKEKP